MNKRTTLFGAAGIAVGLLGLGAWRARRGAGGWRGPISDHFDGERFFYPGGAPSDAAKFVDVLRWQLTGDRRPWPARFPPIDPARPGPRPARGMRATLVNHATVLIQTPTLCVLTDPVWSERVGPGGRLGPARRRAPGVRFDDLPPIDLVLISHSHYDHLDSPTVARLAERDDPLFVCGLGVAELIERFGAKRVRELDWWDTEPIGDHRVTFAPARHWSSRGLGDTDRRLWGSFWLKGPGGSLYFAGDTGWGGHFEQVRRRLGAPDLALLPIGAYEPRWFMRPQHMDPAEAVRAHIALEAKKSLAIHWGTFRLTDEGPEDPKRALDDALLAARLEPGAFAAPLNGGAIEIERPSVEER